MEDVSSAKNWQFDSNSETLNFCLDNQQMYEQIKMKWEALKNPTPQIFQMLVSLQPNDNVTLIKYKEFELITNISSNFSLPLYRKNYKTQRQRSTAGVPTNSLFGGATNNSVFGAAPAAVPTAATTGANVFGQSTTTNSAFGGAPVFGSAPAFGTTPVMKKTSHFLLILRLTDYQLILYSASAGSNWWIGIRRTVDL